MWGDNFVHDLTPPAVPANSERTTDYLAQAGQVRSDTKIFRRATQCETEMGYHFVKKQWDSVLRCHIAHRLEKFRLRLYHSQSESRNRFEDDSPQFVSVLFD